MSTATLPRQGTAGDALVLRMYQRCEWYELALMRQGFSVERLQKLARRVALDQCRLRNAQLDDRIEDLVSRLVLAGLQASLRYDPERYQASYGRNGGEPFSSYLGDIFERRAVDYWRSKSEGFGDRRYGNDNRIVLDDDPDPADHDTDFELLVDDRRRARWQQAADLKGMTISQFMVTAMEIVTDDVLEVAA